MNDPMLPLTTNGCARTRTTAFPLTRILSAECSELVCTVCACRPASAANWSSFASLSHDVFSSLAKSPVLCQQPAGPIELAVVNEDTWFGNIIKLMLFSVHTKHNNPKLLYTASLALSGTRFARDVDSLRAF
jgi:hypothetical protein